LALANDKGQPQSALPRQQQRLWPSPKRGSPNRQPPTSAEN